MKVICSKHFHNIIYYNNSKHINNIIHYNRSVYRKIQISGQKEIAISIYYSLQQLPLGEKKIKTWVEIKLATSTKYLAKSVIKNNLESYEEDQG